MNVGFVSLGCSKNLIDTEMAIGVFKKNKFNIVNNVKEAQIIIINTCGFIDSAKQEAIDTILEMSEYKKTAKCKYLVAMGCLVQRYEKELKKQLPEVDLFITIDEYAQFWKKITKLIRNEKNYDSSNFDYLNRTITTGKTTAYLKIAEGCSNRCTYCAIPYIRGPYISRPMENIIEEAKGLAKNGIKEIIIIAQDTTVYGKDLYGKQMIAKLLEELCKIEEFEWIRFLYSYPESITKELIEVVKKNKKICNYFDIPIQHISNKVLKRMNRRTTGEEIEHLIKNIKKEIPDAILRTSLIVGFPGETEEDFRKLHEFVDKGYFNKLGVFAYSKEDGTPAAKFKEQIHYKTKQKRYNDIMRIAMEKSQTNIKKYIGKTYKTLIENVSADGKFYIGRTYMDIPETDGVVVMKNNCNGLVGKFVEVRVNDVKDYDLIAEILEK